MKRMRKTSRRPPGRFMDSPFAHFVETIACLGFIGAFGYGFYVFAKEYPGFQVRTIEIEGTHRLNEMAVLQESGITSDHNILFFDKEATRGRVEDMAYVKSCVVSLTFPDTINLEIEERTPYLTLLVNSRAYELDEECVVLREYGQSELPDGPYVSNVAGLDFVELGEELTQPALREVVAVWKAYASHTQRPGATVSELAAYSENDIRMYFEEMLYEVRWGRGDADKAARRLAILWKSTGMGVNIEEYVDLRFGADVVCK